MLSLDELQKDPKTRLQEFMQARQRSLPHYKVVDIAGAPHDQSFTIECEVDMLNEVMRATATSRRSAEKLAAEKVLAVLEAD